MICLFVIICLNKLFKLCICIYFLKRNELVEITLNIETHFVQMTRLVGFL